MSIFFYAFFLLFLSAFFSSTETSMFLLSSQKEKSNKLVQKLLKRPILLLNTILLGNMLVNILFANLLEGFLMEEVFHGAFSIQIRIFIVIVLSTFLILVFGEVIPKNIGLAFPSQLARFNAYFFVAIRKLFFPLTFLLTKMTIFFINLWGKEQETHMSKHELRYVLHLSHKKGILKKEETELIEKIINFAHTEIWNLMIPRKDLLAISSQCRLGEAWEKMKGTSSSKMVVYQDNIDHITGFLHINDVMKHTEKFHESILEIPGLLREVHMVPETKNPVEVLKNLRAKKVSFAVVLDEYGGTAGLITINAIMKKIIGACIEESSRKEKQIVHIRPGEIVVNGNVLLREIKDHFAINGEWSNEEDTVASFLLEQFDKIPQSGEKISALGLTWEVVELKTHSISRVKIKGMLK